MLHTEILKENRDFRRMYRQGKSAVAPLVVVYAKRNRLGINRIGITSSKKIGNAVKRNRARRVLRAAYRELEPQVPTGWDFVFVARTRTTLCRSTELAVALKKSLETLVKTK